MWKLDNALVLVRALQPRTREFGYHLALGGGVLNKGASDKDLDLYFLPMGGFGDTKPKDPDKMLAFLEKLWGTSKPLGNDYPYGNQNLLYKHAVKFDRRRMACDGAMTQRIDVFIF